MARYSQMEPLAVRSGDKRPAISAGGFTKLAPSGRSVRLHDTGREAGLCRGRSSGSSAGVGREVLRGAELALERANRSTATLVALDGYGEDRDEQAISNARRAR